MKFEAYDSKEPFEIAPQEYAEIYAGEVEEILRILGLEWAIVTDESTIGDFDAIDDYEGGIKKLEEVLGRKVNYRDLVYRIAKEMFDKENGV